MPITNGYRVWQTLTPVTTAASPVTSGWFETNGFTRLLSWLSVAGGTTVVTVEYSTDGAAVDADFTAQTITTGAMSSLDVLGPWLRFKITQTVADATKTKLYVQARA